MSQAPLAFCAAMAGGLFITTAVAGEATTAIARIGVEPKENAIEIVASAVAVSASQFTGEVTINRTGRSGTVSTRQSRTVELKAGDTADIARAGISFGEGDVLDVKLTLSHDGVVISEASVSAGEK